MNNTNNQKVAVIGAGKMGLPLACAFAARNARVIACDVNSELVAGINRGQLPFDEPGVAEPLAEAVRKGNLSATTDTAAAVAVSDVVIVIVPVMLTSEKEADLTVIESIARILAKSLQRNAMVSFETTLPIGVTRKLGAIIETGGLKAGMDFDLVFSPERVKSRLVMKHLLQNPKIVGGITPKSAARAEAFYGKYLGAPVINVGTLEAAELSKLAGMLYRDVNIALANELANYAQRAGIDFASVRDAANTDGEAALLVPGIGVGGHCTPVYPWFLIQDARRRSMPVVLTETARSINEAQPEKMVARLGAIAGKRALILGLGFRPNVKESACSPAYSLKTALEARNAKVALHDPMFTPDEIQKHGFEPGRPDGQDIIILNTAHPEYAKLDFARLAKAGTKIILDGRDFWTQTDVENHGIKYLCIAHP